MNTSAVIARRTALVLALVVAVLGPASAQVLDQMTSTLTTFDNLHNLGLVATVSRNTDGSYHYDYVLSFTSSWASQPVGTFSVGNLSLSPFSNAANSQPTYYKNPLAYAGGDANRNSVLWSLVSSTTPFPYSSTGSINFSFDSPYSYVQVRATTSGGWGSTRGNTLGIAAPEPASLAGLGAGLAGIAGAFLRRAGAKRRN